VTREIDQQLEESSAMDDADDHLGRVFAVPDAWWGFDAVGREDHPGATVQELPARSEWILLKGTGAENRERIHRTEVLIDPTDENGLFKETVFSLAPRPFRTHRLRNLVPERVMGRLADNELKLLQSSMIRQFGQRG
jgi:hypothetical protein